jgi:hypothetical protein
MSIRSTESLQSEKPRFPNAHIAAIEAFGFNRL